MNRRLGRTTRMLEEAISEAKNGKAVYIIAANNDHKRQLRKSLTKIQNRLQEKSLGIKIETVDSTGNFSWRTTSLRGAHPNCVVMVDHWTIESEFAGILKELHRWD